MQGELDTPYPVKQAMETEIPKQVRDDRMGRTGRCSIAIERGADAPRYPVKQAMETEIPKQVRDDKLTPEQMLPFPILWVW